MEKEPRSAAVMLKILTGMFNGLSLCGLALFLGDLADTNKEVLAALYLLILGMSMTLEGNLSAYTRRRLTKRQTPR